MRRWFDRHLEETLDGLVFAALTTLLIIAVALS